MGKHYSRTPCSGFGGPGALRAVYIHRPTALDNLPGAGSQSHTHSKWLKEARGSVIHARGKLKEELRRSRKRVSGSRKRVSGSRKLEEARGSSRKRVLGSRKLEEARGSVF